MCNLIFVKINFLKGQKVQVLLVQRKRKCQKISMWKGIILYFCYNSFYERTGKKAECLGNRNMNQTLLYPNITYPDSNRSSTPGPQPCTVEGYTEPENFNSGKILV